MPPTSPDRDRPLHAVIVGAGPAGLSAALVLGRARRDILVIDAGEPRNHVSREMGGFLGRDRTDPAALRDQAHADLAHYPHVALRKGRVVAVERRAGGFVLRLEDGTLCAGRKLLIATGVTDDLPPLPGLRAFYGGNVWHCPYCDGYAHADEAIGVIGAGRGAADLALELMGWSSRITLIAGSDPGSAITPRRVTALRRHGIDIKLSAVDRLEGDGGRVRRVHFSNGEMLPVDALFFPSSGNPRHGFALDLGLEVEPRSGAIKGRRHGRTAAEGVFAAGDAVSHVQLAIVAAGEGAAAAFALNKELLREDAASRLRRTL